MNQITDCADSGLRPGILAKARQAEEEALHCSEWECRGLIIADEVVLDVAEALVPYVQELRSTIRQLTIEAHDTNGHSGFWRDCFEDPCKRVRFQLGINAF